MSKHPDNVDCDNGPDCQFPDCGCEEQGTGSSREPSDFDPDWTPPPPAWPHLPLNARGFHGQHQT